MNAQRSSSILGRLGVYLNIHLLYVRLQSTNIKITKLWDESGDDWFMFRIALLHTLVYMYSVQCTVSVSQIAFKAWSNYLARYHIWRQLIYSFQFWKELKGITSTAKISNQINSNQEVKPTSYSLPVAILPKSAIAPGPEGTSALYSQVLGSNPSMSNKTNYHFIVKPC